jgi:hypothetical protein
MSRFAAHRPLLDVEATGRRGYLRGMRRTPSVGGPWGRAFPRSAKYRERRNSFDMFEGRPDQIDGRTRSVTVKHERDSFTVPVTINGKTDDFLLDTGALHSVMTDREARKLGLTVGDGIRSMTGASGLSTRFRTAIAPHVTVGATSFQNVSFAVMESVGPWQDAEGGIVGLPLFIGLGAIRWSNDGRPRDN